MSNHRVCEHRTPPSAMADGGQAPRAPLPEPVFVCAPGTARRPTSPSARLVVPSSPGSTLAVTLTVASLIPCTSPHASVHAPTVPCSACLPCCCSSTSAAPQPRARPCSCRPSSVHWPLSAPASRSTAPGTRTLATTGRAPAVPWPHPAAPIITPRPTPLLPSTTTELTTPLSCQSNQTMEPRIPTPPSTTNPTTLEVPTTTYSPLTTTRSS
ncbi:hypothetical protein ACQJBY_015489 [Aegilops geniculata]